MNQTWGMQPQVVYKQDLSKLNFGYESLSLIWNLIWLVSKLGMKDFFDEERCDLSEIFELNNLFADLWK